MCSILAGCASRRYHSPHLQSIELRNAKVVDLRDQRITDQCDIASWIYDAGHKRWIAVCK